MAQIYILSQEYREKALELRNHSFGADRDEQEVVKQYYKTMLRSPDIFNDTTIAAILKKRLSLNNIKTIKILQMILNPQDNDNERLQTLLADLLDENLSQQIRNFPELFIPAIKIIAVLAGEKLGIVTYDVINREYDNYAHDEYHEE